MSRDKRLHVYFITDGTLYHDGDTEEIYGVVITRRPKRGVERTLCAIAKQLKKTPDIYQALAARCQTYNTTHPKWDDQMLFVPYELDYSNRIGVRT